MVRGLGFSGESVGHGCMIVVWCGWNAVVLSVFIAVTGEVARIRVSDLDHNLHIFVFP